MKYNNYKKEGTNNSFYRKSGGNLDISNGLASIKEMRGKSIVWKEKYKKDYFDASVSGYSFDINTGIGTFVGTSFSGQWKGGKTYNNHKYYCAASVMSSEVSPSTNLCLWGFGQENRIYFTQTTWKRQAVISKQTQNYTYLPWQINEAVEGVTYYIKNPVLIDLTLMFGAGNEPSSVAEFEKMFPLDYYDYNEGEVIPFAAQNLTTTGKNQYNPATGKANLLGGQTYQLLGTYTSATIDGVAVTLDSNNSFTTTKDCVLEITGGNDTDTFVGLYNGETNTYEPYEKHTLPLDPSQWRDKNGDLVFPYGGMHGYGTAYDYAKVDADGYIRKAVRVYERRAYESGDVTDGNIITDGRTYTFYPLATLIEVELATPVYAKYLVDKDGTEEIAPANGTAPYTTPPDIDVIYNNDVAKIIRGANTQVKKVYKGTTLIWEKPQ